MTLVTRTLASTGVRIQFQKGWPNSRDTIDATKFTPGQEFPGNGRADPNFTRGNLKWDPKHPLIQNMEALGANFWNDPLDPVYLVGTEERTIERTDPKNHKKKRQMVQAVAVWQHRAWFYRRETEGRRAPWTRTTERPDPKVLFEEERVLVVETADEC